MGRSFARVEWTTEKLVRVETQLWNALDARLRTDCGLTYGRFEVLKVIEETGSCRVIDIAQRLTVTISGISKLVDRIEATGYCMRESNPTDGRSSVIVLTPAGQRRVTLATAIVRDELNSQIGQALSARELRQLSKTLTTVHKRLERGN